MSRMLELPPGYSDGKFLGKGGFGEVYKATNPQGRVCAMKTIDISQVYHKELARQEWKKEFTILMKVDSHPAIVQLYGYLDGGNKLWVEMEYCSGGDLQTYFLEKGVTKPQKRQFMMEIASAVDHLHNNEIIHRDLKPENILVTYDSSQKAITKMGDFGLAKAISNTSFEGNLDQYYMNAEYGTKYYMAPELFEQNQTRYTYKADVFSLGVVFSALIEETVIGDYLTAYVLDTNNTQWPAGEYASNISNKKKVCFELNPDLHVGASLRGLIAEMLLYDYHKRPTAKEVYIRLREYISAGEFDDDPKSRELTHVPVPHGQ